MTGLRARRTRLLLAICRGGGEWTTDRAHRVLRDLGAPKRATARRDLDALRRAGLLHQSGTKDRRAYVLAQGRAA